MARAPFILGDESIAAGSRRTVDMPIMDLTTHTPVSMPVQVIHGRHDGPVLFLCAAIHGDEINGVEVIRRLLRLRALRSLRGTLMAVPIVNVFGFLSQSRYLPDRRDLNRSFPGSEKGSMAGRLAHFFLHEIVAKADYGIDLHTGATHRTNFPQIRADLDDPETARLADAFGVPIVINAGLREGSLRAAAGALDIPILVYEAGEALRFDDLSIRAGVRGIVRVMRSLNMLAPGTGRRPQVPPVTIRNSHWERAPVSGILRRFVEPGRLVEAGARLGVIADPVGENEADVTARSAGIVVGGTTTPVVNEGDALFHIGTFEGAKVSADALDAFERAEDDISVT